MTIRRHLGDFKLENETSTALQLLEGRIHLKGTEEGKKKRDINVSRQKPHGGRI